VTKLLLALALPVTALALAACGGSSPHNNEPTIQKVLVTQVADFKPAGPVAVGKPVTISFRILQPNAAGTKLVTMTRFRKGAGPHTGVHMIIVRDDLGVIIHQHPPVKPNGVFTQQVTFPKPGPYRVVLDVYPATGPQTNFQLLNERIRVTGAYKPQPLPAPVTSETVDGYHFTIDKIVPSPLKAIESALMYLTVTDPQGKPVTFVPWFGALAHAIFFHAGRFEYFHTHVCSPGAGGCTSLIAGSKVVGSSATPGHITVGVLLPDSGTWQLFLQLKAGGKILSAPFTLRVGA
jgi:hypothetical protein